MKTIWKFPLKLEAQYELEMPSHSELLHVGRQGGYYMLWALCDPARSLQRRKFFTFATGEPFEPQGKQYLATVHYGEYVWHIYTESY